MQVAADPLGGWVLAERQFRRTKDRFYYVRVMTLSAGGRLAGAIQDLGPGQFGIDARPTMSLAVDDTGRALLAFVPQAPFSPTARPTVVVTARPHGGAFGAPGRARRATRADDPRVAVGEGGRALIAATQVRSSGDAGSFGNPVVAGIDPAGALGAPFGPAVDDPAPRVRARAPRSRAAAAACSSSSSSPRRSRSRRARR